MELLKKTINNIKSLDKDAMSEASKRQDILTKPKGSLGRLEELSVQIAGIQRRSLPVCDKKAILTFAGDHHVVYEEGIASAPIEITAQMVANFTRGGAAVNILADHCGARVVVIDQGVASEYERAGYIKNKFIAPGAANIAKGPAMSREQAIRALEGGIETVMEELENGLDIIGVGEMGIGNTTPSSAIYSLYTGLEPDVVTGPGAGIDEEIVKRKIEVVKKAIEINKPDKNDAIDVLSKIGGFEIGGMAGAMLGAAANNIPVVVDGFISTAAACLARTLCPGIDDYLILSHHSAETGFIHASNYVGQKPLLDLGLRLGEGTGAALGISIVEASIKALKKMATFEQAGVIDVKEI
ncbi:MAG: nicotinate-nucleotide--dimethylbenzimidazole phosphoribosyltransferase [Deltaproteobacteria bacterium]|nr:nicotinate-nucleotide--dimethylbenzimidazole phosphoribosyltransferase [Deltaproteobacteria bacterium]